MRTSFVVALLCAVALTAGVIGLLKGRSTAQESKPAVEIAAERGVNLPAGSVTSRQTSIRRAPQTPEVAVDVPSPLPTSPAPEVETSAEAAPVSTPFSRAIDTLVSSRASFQQKQSALDQLYASGQLSEAIESLERGIVEHPASAVYPAALGRVQLTRAGELSQSGGSISDMGILGMNADKNFDTALELDPSNWEAQFFKAAAMSYWPLELNKGEEVIQRLSVLIDQQDTMMARPEFAQTYVVLGNQYQKMGQPDYAVATWQIGATKFPGDSTLLNKSQGR